MIPLGLMINLLIVVTLRVKCDNWKQSLSRSRATETSGLDTSLLVGNDALPQDRPLLPAVAQQDSQESGENDTQAPASDQPAAAVSFTKQAWRTSLVLMTLSYAAVTNSCLALLHCVEIDTHWVLFQYPATACDTLSSSPYNIWFVIGVLLLLLVVIGFPITFLTVALRSKSKLQADSAFSPIIAPYKPLMFFWEAVDLLRRTLFLILANFVVDPSLRQSLLVLFIASVLCSTIAARPYVIEKENYFELFLLCDAFVLALFVPHDTTDYSQLVLTTVLLSLSLLAFLALALDRTFSINPRALPASLSMMIMVIVTGATFAFLILRSAFMYCYEGVYRRLCGQSSGIMLAEEEATYASESDSDDSGTA